jgi:prepilin-type N-terminal cleavage/methylation domain-containing protein
MNKKGVTLIELIVVMVIIGIGAVLFAPNIGGWMSNYRLRSATRDLVSTMRTAQMRAVSTNIAYGVAFDANAYQLYRSSGGLTTEGGVTNLPQGVQFNNINFPINATLNKPFAQFNADSTSSGGNVTLQSIKGSKIKGSRIISVAPTTGKVTIQIQ